MKLSEILGWEKKGFLSPNKSENLEVFGFNTAIKSCDREIDREALAKAMFKEYYWGLKEYEETTVEENKRFFNMADHIISTMPTWLKRIEK